MNPENKNFCSCIYAEFVHCVLHNNCKHCGWNPEVQKMRSIKIRTSLPEALFVIQTVEKEAGYEAVY